MRIFMPTLIVSEDLIRLGNKKNNKEAAFLQLPYTLCLNQT